MSVEAKRLICTNHECRAEIIVLRKPIVERQNLRCACGSEFKRIYHPPVVKVLGTAVEVAGAIPLDINSGHVIHLGRSEKQGGSKTNA